MRQLNESWGWIAQSKERANLWEQQRLEPMYLSTKFTDKTRNGILIDNWLIHNVLGTLGIQQCVDCLRVTQAWWRYCCVLHTKNATKSSTDSSHKIVFHSSISQLKLIQGKRCIELLNTNETESAAKLYTQVLADTNGPCYALRHSQSSSCCAQSWQQ